MGAGRVGNAIVTIAAHRDSFNLMVVSDYDLGREHSISPVMNAVEQKFVSTIFAGALDGGADYLDVAMSLSGPHPTQPHSKTGVRHGDDQFAPSFSFWTTIEECLNPLVVCQKKAGWFTTPPFGEPEVFDFPEGIGPVEESVSILKTLKQLGLDKTTPVKVRSADGPVHVALWMPWRRQK